MPALRVPFQRVLIGLALASLASPTRAMDCREENYSCPNNGYQCRWVSCIENGVEVYFYKKWCDGQAQTIINGNGYVVQEEPCEENENGGGEQDDNEGHVRHKYGF